MREDDVNPSDFLMVIECVSEVTTLNLSQHKRNALYEKAKNLLNELFGLANVKKLDLTRDSNRNI